MKVANKVIKNTGFLYAKMGITMFISLYTTRLVLNALGGADYGVFNVVGGAIAMMGFLHAAMAGATQRFMSFYEGKGEGEKQKQIFNVSIVLHFLIAIALIIVFLIVGYFFFNGVLNIDPDRLYAAKVVYCSLIVSTIFTVTSVPYEAVLNAHENMLYYSIVGVIESILKLVVAFIIVYYGGDKLVLYGVLMACIPLIVLTIMRVYCHKKYEECVILPKKYYSVILMKEMSSFAGWSFLGTASSMFSQHGMAIVLNNFFGSKLNAAMGIAGQLNGQLMAFSNNMMKAVNPVIVKREGEGNRTKMLDTSMISAKFAYLLLAFFAIPFIIETPYILKLWLNKVPEWTILFVRLQLLRSLIEQLFIMIDRAIAAQGEINKYMKVKSVVNLLPILLTYLFFSWGYPPYYVYVVWIVCWGVLGGGVTLYFANKNCNLNYKEYFINVIRPTFLVTLVVFTVGFLTKLYFKTEFFSLVSVVIVSCLSFVIVYAFVFSTKQEKQLFRQVYSRVFLKNKKH